MSKIMVVGSSIVDIAAYTDHFPVEGETTLGDRLKFGPGGKGNNQATAAARLGADVFMITKLGNDFLGSIMSEHYQKENMSQKYIYKDGTLCTGSAVIEVDRDGNNRIIIFKDANDNLTAKEVELANEDFENCDVLVMQLETSIESILEGKRLAQKYSKPIILNPAPFQSIPTGLFSGIDYLTPNETEAEFFTGIPVEDEHGAAKAADRLHEMGIKNVIITLGKRGAFFSNGSTRLLVPTTDLKPVDTAGAGDAFNGGLAVAVAEGMDIETALKFANCVASISVTRHGTAPAMPNRDEAEKLLKDFYNTDI